MTATREVMGVLLVEDAPPYPGIIHESNLGDGSVVVDCDGEGDSWVKISGSWHMTADLPIVHNTTGARETLPREYGPYIVATAYREE